MSFTLYHGSEFKLEIGTILRASVNYPTYVNNVWNDILFHFRPQNCDLREESVFLVDDIDSVDLAGGSIDYIYACEPLANFSRHDVNWISEIEGLFASSLEDMDDWQNSPRIARIAKNYWNGKPHYNESIMEILTKKAKILELVEVNCLVPVGGE